MSSIDFVLRVAGVVLLILLIAILLRGRSRDLRTISALWLAASVAAFLLTSMRGADALLGAFIYPLTALCSTHAVWFWLFSMALFADGAKLRVGHVVCLVAMALGGTLYQALWPTAADSSAVKVLGMLFSAAWLGFACLAPATVMRGMAGDLDPRRRRIRRWFVPAAAAYLALVVLVQGFGLLYGRPTPAPLVVLNLAILDAIALLALASFLRVRVDNWLDVVDHSPRIALTRTEQQALDALQRRFAAERLYAREGLSIVALAELLGTQEHVLRRVINEAQGYRNFNDFLHHHRLREAAARLRDPSMRRVPVLTIAMDVGYGSVGPFNRAFRDRFGMTPSEYRRVPPDLDAAVSVEG